MLELECGDVAAGTQGEIGPHFAKLQQKKYKKTGTTIEGAGTASTWQRKQNTHPHHRQRNLELLH